LGVHADLSLLNTEQLIALKQLALIASAGSTATISGSPIHLFDKLINERRAEEEQAKIARDFAKLRKQQARRGGLIDFVRYFWHTLEPQTRKLIEGWPLEAICLHLEAVTFGDITRLLINVPPGFMTSSPTYSGPPGNGDR
jgi:hypothetical protein